MKFGLEPLSLVFLQIKNQSIQPMSKVKKDERFEVKDKDQYRVKNWSIYNKALENRGNITLYFDEEAIKNWYSLSSGQRGGQEVYSDVCIEAIMMIKTVFKQAYRQAVGFTKSLLRLMNLSHLKVPSYTQVNRRFGALKIKSYDIPVSENLTIAIDSTGVKVYGEGEWKCRKHGWSKRRTWRKLHLGVDPDTGFIHCHTTTTNSESDESQVDDLLDQIEQPVKEVYLDGAYDAQSCFDNLIEREINPVIPPQKGAVEWYWEEPDDHPDYPSAYSGPTDPPIPESTDPPIPAH
jgi:uncharacterized protein YggL (DUF469 family)